MGTRFRAETCAYVSAGRSRRRAPDARAFAGHARTAPAIRPANAYLTSGIMSIAPHGHSSAQMPQPLQ